ncbi:MAG TPA: hypothetical protein VJL80_08145 [Aeromicrobium sp.]|nr:hypothetical protein [Aeromicrobium sp.]HKY57990.1 hypothetical protein [Aeromicrobium sp.]
MRAQREDIKPVLGRAAVTLAVLAAGFVPVAYAAAALVLAIGGPSESQDAVAALAGKVAAIVGLAMAVLAFGCAIASRLRREPVESLWFPLTLLPVLVALSLAIYVVWVR